MSATAVLPSLRRSFYTTRRECARGGEKKDLTGQAGQVLFITRDSLAACATATGGAVCAGLWLQFGGCARASRQISCQLPPGYEPCHPSARTGAAARALHAD